MFESEVGGSIWGAQPPPRSPIVKKSDVAPEFKAAGEAEISQRPSYDKTVIISVRGGVAEVEYAPPGIYVDIRDYDNLEA